MGFTIETIILDCVHNEIPYVGQMKTPRYIIRDPDTDEIIVDNDGKGYKSEKKAMMAYYWLLHSPTKRRQKHDEKRRVYEWAIQNEKFLGTIDRVAAKCMANGHKLTPQIIKELFIHYNLKCPTTPTKFLIAYDNNFYETEVLKRNKKIAQYERIRAAAKARKPDILSKPIKIAGKEITPRQVTERTKKFIDQEVKPKWPKRTYDFVNPDEEYAFQNTGSIDLIEPSEPYKKPKQQSDLVIIKTKEAVSTIEETVMEIPADEKFPEDVVDPSFEQPVLRMSFDTTDTSSENQSNTDMAKFDEPCRDMEERSNIADSNIYKEGVYLVGDIEQEPAFPVVVSRDTQTAELAKTAKTINSSPDEPFAPNDPGITTPVDLDPEEKHPASVSAKDKTDTKTFETNNDSETKPDILTTQTFDTQEDDLLAGLGTMFSLDDWSDKFEMSLDNNTALLNHQNVQSHNGEHKKQSKVSQKPKTSGVSSAAHDKPKSATQQPITTKSPQKQKTPSPKETEPAIEPVRLPVQFKLFGKTINHQAVKNSISKAINDFRTDNQYD